MTGAGDWLVTVLLVVLLCCRAVVPLAKSSDLLRGGFLFGIAKEGFIMSIMTAKSWFWLWLVRDAWECSRPLASRPAPFRCWLAKRYFPKGIETTSDGIID